MRRASPLLRRGRAERRSPRLWGRWRARCCAHASRRPGWARRSAGTWECALQRRGDKGTRRQTTQVPSSDKLTSGDPDGLFLRPSARRSRTLCTPVPDELPETAAWTDGHSRRFSDGKLKLRQKELRTNNPSSKVGRMTVVRIMHSWASAGGGRQTAVL
ncbi:hypothetical protein NDU88_000825 [Pleurodeles waltl]|uniref:Uncharacterized protein n=1 Tax=Pleurodeles waltl TaxID=8319 RepID=A0AAV7SB63_PLEWA|nr:hypothetical protein NDU88_000825 [Pleurodeles waltl]